MLILVAFFLDFKYFKQNILNILNINILYNILFGIQYSVFKQLDRIVILKFGIRIFSIPNSIRYLAIGFSQYGIVFNIRYSVISEKLNYIWSSYLVKKKVFVTLCQGIYCFKTLLEKVYNLAQNLKVAAIPLLSCLFYQVVIPLKTKISILK